MEVGPVGRKPRRRQLRRAPAGTRVRDAQLVAVQRYLRLTISGKYVLRTFTGGIGHNIPQESLKAFAQATIDAKL